MSLEDKDFGLGKGQIPVNLDLYVKWVEEVPKLKQRIDKLEGKNNKLKSIIEQIDKDIGKEMGFNYAPPMSSEEKIQHLINRVRKVEQESKKIKDENIGLRELLGKGSSGWEIIADQVAVGINPFTGEKEQFGFPKDFDEKKAHALHFTDDNFYMCKFKYYFDNERPWPYGNFREFDMAITLFKHLCKISKLPKSKLLDSQDIHDLESMKRYITLKGWEIPKSKYFEKMAKFVLAKRGKSNTFYAGELDQRCGFKDNRVTRRQLCKKFIEWGFLKEMKKQGYYEVIF